MGIVSGYEKYLEYIKNAGGRPKIEHFDEDWDPIGPQVRAGMKASGLIDESGGYMIALRDDPLGDLRP